MTTAMIRVVGDLVRRDAGTRSWVGRTRGQLALCLMCAAIGLHAVRTAGGRTLEGEQGVPLVAAMSICVGVLLWSPRADSAATRPVTASLSIALLIVAGELFLLGIFDPRLGTVVVGPMCTAALIGTYLACWGFRSLFLLRRVAILSLLMWDGLAGAVHEAVRRSIDQPSDLVYRRLGSIDAYDIGENQWRLFGAMMHDGALAVLAAAVLWFATTRIRFSPTFVSHLTGVVAGALLVHHAVVLAHPVESYHPNASTRFVLGGAFELAVAVGVTLAVCCVHQRRHASAPPRAVANLSDRDPMIFSGDDTTATMGVARAAGALVPLLMVCWTSVVAR